MRVTKKQFPMEEKVIHKIDMLIRRCTQNKPKLDSFILIDGYEGYGKTTLSIALGYYIHYKTGRPFTDQNLFFDIDELISFAQSTENQIIIWDEAGLGGLSTEWFTQSQINLTKLMMTVRKKRHFFIFNIPRIKKINEYLAMDRSLGLLHVYAKHEKEVGRFVYYKRKRKDRLFDEIKKSKSNKPYKHYSFRGTFPDVLDSNKDYNVLEIFDNERYEEKKTKAIESIGKKKESKRNIELNAMKYMFFKCCERFNLTQTQTETIFGIKQRTLSGWGRLAKENDEVAQYCLEKWGFSG